MKTGRLAASPPILKKLGSKNGVTLGTHVRKLFFHKMDYNHRMIIMLLLFSFLSQAEDMSSEKYCFATKQHSLSAAQKFKAIQVSSDMVTVDDQCLIIQMRPHRREIIQRYLLSTFPGAYVAFSSENSRRDPCQLKVEKEKVKEADNLEIGNRNNIVINKTNQNTLSSETMQIQTLKDFELTVDQDQIKGSCRYLNADRYEISIEVRRNPKLPLINTQPAEDQETMTLQTQLQLTRGERIELGSVVRNLRDKNHQVDITPNIEMNRSNQKVSESVFLSIQ